MNWLGHFGFSYVGLAFLLLLFAPNLLWIGRKPKGYAADGERSVFRVLERVGEVLGVCFALVFRDFNPRPWTTWSLWLVIACAWMALHELWWFRYFRSARELADFYASLFGIPVAGATLPVAAFLSLGLYGRVIWMVLAALILGVGHIGIHMEHRRNLRK